MNEPQSKPAYSEAAKTLSPGLIAVAVLLVAVIGIEIWTWIFAGSNAEEIAFRSGVVRNMGLLAVGVIGLPLAIWRSYTAHKQADEAAKQGARTDKQLQLTLDQMKITTESNHVDLLERSAALLDLSDENKRQTAVSFLTTLGEDNSSTYASAARQLLVSIIEGQECTEKRPAYIVNTLNWMEFYCNRNKTTIPVKDVRFINSGVTTRFFENITGISYIGGFFQCVTINDVNGSHFENARIKDSIIGGSVYLSKRVIIENSRIQHLPMFLDRNSQAHFFGCDFTSCSVFPTAFMENEITFVNCFFRDVEPPTNIYHDQFRTKLAALSETEYANRIKDMYVHTN
ncbi:MAG: hypothetical protein P1V13_23520 [Rhizobiaceae bacterium]|nr:hypothetical protein [Rhizobiaceae bacterium]